MVFYGFIQNRRVFRSNFRRVIRAFSLLEVVLVLFIIGALATALVPSVREIIERSRGDAEKRTLDELARTITASFEATDLTNLNIAALPGTIGTSDSPTTFSSSTSAAYATTSTTVWFAKIARLRGITPQLGVAPTPAAQPELARIAQNTLGNPRLLFAAPDESGRQRFLIVSLMARSDQLALPAYEANSAWFDAIWNHDWESRTATLPAYWQSRLTPAQAAAWTQGVMTQLHRFCVRRIVLPKYRLTINNNHPTNAAFVSFNNTSNAFTAPANSGANTTPEILGGRLVTINQGSTWPGVESLRFHLHSNDTVIVQ